MAFSLLNEKFILYSKYNKKKRGGGGRLRALQSECRVSGVKPVELRLGVFSFSSGTFGLKLRLEL